MKRDFTGNYVTIATQTERARAYIPADLPPNPPIEWTQDLRSKFDRALLALGRLDSIPTFLPDSARFIPLLNGKEAILSSISEEKQTSFEDLLHLRLEDGTVAENSNLNEVKRLSELIGWTWKAFESDEVDFLALLNKAHKILLGPDADSDLSPGSYRPSLKSLSVTQPGNAAFIPTPADKIPDCMEGLRRFISGRPTPTPFLLKAALAQAQFELIQPFVVGNSRIARLMLTMFIRQNKVMSSPILITSRYFAGHRREYFEALNGVRTNGDWEAWLGYYAEGVAESAEKSFTDIQALSELVSKDTRRISELGRPAESAMHVLNAMVSQPVATSNWLVAKTGITPATVNKSLAHLEELGIIRETTSRRRNRIFTYKTCIGILNEGIEGVFV